MKYYTKTYFETKIHITEIDPSKGYLVLTKGVGLEPVKDIRHPWIIENKDVLETPAVSINCSFFNADGSRNGAEMRDASKKWTPAPYGDTYIMASWNNDNELWAYNTYDYSLVEIEEDEQWIVGVGSLVRNSIKRTEHTIVGGVAPRSAIGQRNDKTVVFVCTDDRPSGLTIDQLAKIMLDLKCGEAFALDGGGSSTMVVNGETMNKCSDRPVYDAIQFYSKEKVEVEKVIPKKKVLLDCGHGGTDPGAVSPNGDREVDQNYGVMLELEKILLAHGLDVSTIGHPDTYTSRTDRVKYERAVKPDIFVSIHKNAYESTWNAVTGVETFCYKFGGNGEKLARLVQDSLIKETKMKNRHVKEADYYVVKNTLAPAILCELGFVTNITDAKQTNDPVWHKRYATGIAKGILHYFGMEYTVDDEPNDFVVAYTQEEHDSLVNMAEQMKELAEYMLGILNP